MCKTYLVLIYLQSSWNETSGTRPLGGPHAGNHWSKPKRESRVGKVTVL